MHSGGGRLPGLGRVLGRVNTLTPPIASGVSRTGAERLQIAAPTVSAGGRGEDTTSEAPVMEEGGMEVKVEFGSAPGGGPGGPNVNRMYLFFFCLGGGCSFFFCLAAWGEGVWDASL